MKHFEVTIFMRTIGFTYECSTAHEALDAISYASAEMRLNLDLDAVMMLLVSMKNGKTISHCTDKYLIEYLDGEV